MQTNRNEPTLFHVISLVFLLLLLLRFSFVLLLSSHLFCCGSRTSRSGRWVTLEARMTDFVDFIDEDDGVVALHCLEGLNETTGNGTDIRSTMAFDLRNIMQTANTEAIEGTERAKVRERRRKEG